MRKWEPHLCWCCVLWMVFIGATALGHPAVCVAEEAPPPRSELRVPLDPKMVQSSSALADFSGIADEQSLVADPPSGTPKRGWEIPAQHWKQFPYSATVDLGQTRNLSALWLFDTHGTGVLTVAAGDPGKWIKIAGYDCGRYMEWVRLPLDATARHLRIELESPGAGFTEVALYEYTPEAHRAMLDRKAAEAKTAAEREAALRQAREEEPRRPWVELPSLGRLRLVDEVDCAAAEPGHEFREGFVGASRVETLLGRPCRVLNPTDDQCAYTAFRLGKWKLLRPGAAYVLAVEYPEDQPRSVLVMCGGNESSRGFHAGTSVGDALEAKYVNSNIESLRVPLSGRYENWTLLFNLHDRFPDIEFLRGAKERKLAAEDGFWVTIAQFTARNDPTSRGAAVARIRLLEVPDEAALAQPLRLPPAPLPERRIFWREEMADGVIESDKEGERGLKDRLDWYRFKANQMRFLGINTFSKDLLEFGACQHWDSTPYGGNEWVHFAYGAKDLWAEIVALMGKQGFAVLPYYEYAGSKGDRGLGYQRRCKPLTRDDAYTHISWVESANADITDPDTYADFRKMLDLTVLRLMDRARFAGVWLRPRWQLPMSFADGTRKRFAEEVRGGKAVSRADLIADKTLLTQYEEWWFGKRRDFLAAMRDYLRGKGVADAVVLYTAEGGEPGTPFPTWERRVVTDDMAAWQQVLAGPQFVVDNRRITAFDLRRVVEEDLYLEALLAPQLNWGNWEVHHANPPADPARYRDVPGVLLTHCFNRLYTVASPKTFDAFRGPAGLAIVRHYALNEHMMFDKQDQPILGYFVADIERAGPYCMMAEATAVANGDPTMIGYLTGGNFGRGFPRYVREFNANFLALPALPSTRLAQASADPEVVVRQIRTPAQGTYLAVVNTGFLGKRGVRVRLPADGMVRDAVSGEAVPVHNGSVDLDLGPFQLRSLLSKD